MYQVSGGDAGRRRSPEPGRGRVVSTGRSAATCATRGRSRAPRRAGSEIPPHKHCNSGRSGNWAEGRGRWPCDRTEQGAAVPTRPGSAGALRAPPGSRPCPGRPPVVRSHRWSVLFAGEAADAWRRTHVGHGAARVVLSPPSAFRRDSPGPPACLAGRRPSLRSAASRSAPSSALLASAAAGSARTTNALSRFKVPRRDATRCRNRRATRCRTTELPTALLTTKPTFDSSASIACSTRRRRPARAPPRMTVRNSSLRRTRARAGSTSSRRADQAESRSRPLRRRAATMARPARVRMRSRNPWVRARRRLFGWKVRLPLLTAKFSWSRLRHPRTGVSCGQHVCLWCLLPTSRSELVGLADTGTQKRPAVGGRPYEGTHPVR